MDVLMLGWEFPPFRSGGLGTHVYHLTQNVAKKGANITYMMPKNPFDIKCGWMKLVYVDPSLMWGPYTRTTSVDSPAGRNFFDDVWKYNQVAVQYALKQKFDVIHCHDWMTSMAGIEIKQKTGKPLLVTIHSTEFDRTGNLSPNPWIVEREYNMVRSADLIITVSKRMKAQLVERYGADEKRVRVIYNAVDHDSFGAEQMERIGDAHVVLFLGRLTLQKGPDYFLRTAHKVLEHDKNFRFVIAGRGDMMPQLIQEAIGLGIMDKVMFLGYVPDDELAQLYTAADVYVLPSVSEPFGISALEAIASGTPAIVSKQSGVSEVARHVFSVDFWDTEEMANKILGLCHYDTLRHEMKANARREVSDRRWDEVADRTVEVYNSLL